MSNATDPRLWDVVPGLQEEEQGLERGPRTSKPNEAPESPLFPSLDQIEAKSRKELALQVRDLQRLHERTARLVGVFDLKAILEECLAAALEVHDSTRGALSLFDEKTGTLKIAASAGLDPGFLEKVKQVPIGLGACGSCFQERKRVIVMDVETDPLFEPYREAARQAGFRAVHSTPLITREAKVIGALSVHLPTPGRPSDRQIRLMDLYARQAADMIESSRLGNQSRRLASIVESSDDGIIAKDLHGTITDWNRGAERLFGYRAEEVIGKSITILIPPERLGEEPKILDAIRRGQPIEHYETLRRRKDGSLVDISLTVSPIRGPDGSIIGASKIARDITDKKRAEERLEAIVAERTSQLRETMAELEAFSYSIAHDMRAPLRAMNSFAQILKEEFADRLPNEGKFYLERIGCSAERLDRLIQDVLNYSRINRCDMPLEKVDLASLIRDIIDSYSHLRDCGGTIFVQSPMPWVRANPAGLTQCLSNLLTNAVKFVKPGVKPQIRLWAEQQKSTVRIWVEDNGIGIAEDCLHRVFDMFQQLNRAGEFEGTGIGLTIVRKAMERMGGRVGVESQVGVGSRFWLELNGAAD